MHSGLHRIQVSQSVVSARVVYTSRAHIIVKDVHIRRVSATSMTLDHIIARDVRIRRVSATSMTLDHIIARDVRIRRVSATSMT